MINLLRFLACSRSECSFPTWFFPHGSAPHRRSIGRADIPILQRLQGPSRSTRISCWHRTTYTSSELSQSLLARVNDFAAKKSSARRRFRSVVAASFARAFDNAHIKSPRRENTGRIIGQPCAFSVSIHFANRHNKFVTLLS